MMDDTGPCNEDTPRGYNAGLSLPTPASTCASSSRVSMEEFSSYSPSLSLSSVNSYCFPDIKGLIFIMALLHLTLTALQRRSFRVLLFNSFSVFFRFPRKCETNLHFSTT